MKPLDISRPPPIGVWLIPAGRWYGYCYRVLWAETEADARGDARCVEVERWGLDAQRRPLRDAHAAHHWLHGLLNVLPGVWRDPHDITVFGPRYYRMDTRGPAPTPARRAQQELFA